MVLMSVEGRMQKKCAKKWVITAASFEESPKTGSGGRTWRSGPTKKERRASWRRDEEVEELQTRRAFAMAGAPVINWTYYVGTRERPQNASRSDHCGLVSTSALPAIDSNQFLHTFARILQFQNCKISWTLINMVLTVDEQGWNAFG